MRAGWILAASAAAALMAQQAPRVDTVRGMLLEWDTSESGQMLVRAADNTVHCIRFDAATAVDSNGWKTRMVSLHKGDMVEVATMPYASRQSYARSVRLLSSAAAAAPRPARRERSAGPARSIYDSLDDLFPRGDLTLSGTVVEVTSGRVVLRTREKETTSILLRKDTRFFQGGRPSSAAELRVNMRVFVRAGKNLDNDLEAYRVIWGQILRPGK